MEKPQTNYLEESLEEDSEENEKSKKSKKFLNFISRIIKDKKENLNKDVEKKDRSILDIIKLFKNNNSEKTDDTNEETNNEVSDINQEEIVEYLDESIKSNIDKLENNNLSAGEKEFIITESIILSKIKYNIDIKNNVDIDEIINETDLEMQLNANIKEPEDLSPDDHINSERTIIIDESYEKNIDIDKKILNSSEKPRDDEVLKKVNSSKNKLPDKETGETRDYTKEPSGDRAPLPPTNSKVKNNEHTQYRESVNKANPQLIFNNTPNNPRNNPNSINNNLGPNIISKSRPNNYANYIEPQRKNEQIFTRSKSIENKNIENYRMNDIELIKAAEKVYLDKISLRSIYENSDLTRDDLRKILSGESKKKLSKDVKRALNRRNNKYSDVINKVKGNISTGHKSNLTQSSTNSNNISTNPANITKNVNNNLNIPKKQKRSEITPRPLLTIFAMIILFGLFLSILEFIIFKHK